MTKLHNFRMKLKFEDRLIMDEKCDSFDSLFDSIKRMRRKFL